MLRIGPADKAVERGGRGLGFLVRAGCGLDIVSAGELERSGKFFGHRVEFTDLAQRHGMNRKTVAEHHALICRRLKELEERVQVSADDALKAVGMVKAEAA